MKTSTIKSSIAFVLLILLVAMIATSCMPIEDTDSTYGSENTETEFVGTITLYDINGDIVEEFEASYIATYSYSNTPYVRFDDMEGNRIHLMTSTGSFKMEVID